MGVVGSYASTSNSGPSPMEIDAVTWKGTGKQKGKDSKSKGKGKDGKGKDVSSWNSSPKGKGKGKDSSEGKSHSGGKGSNQGSKQKLDPNQCAYCYKFGHRKADCRKVQHDKAAGGIRQVQDDDGSDQNDGSGNNGASSSNASPPANVQNIRAASKVGPHVPYVQDLTDFEQYLCSNASEHSSACAAHHDMTFTESLSIQGHVLRGISWRTSTSVSGQPWGVCCIGLALQLGHWVFQFFHFHFFFSIAFVTCFWYHGNRNGHSTSLGEKAKVDDTVIRKTLCFTMVKI